MEENQNNARLKAESRNFINAESKARSVNDLPEGGNDNENAYIVCHIFELSEAERAIYGAAVTNTVDVDQICIDTASDTLGILQANLARMMSEKQHVVVESLTKNAVGQQSSDESGKKGSCVGSVSCNSSQAARKENDGATAARSADHAALIKKSHEEAFMVSMSRRFNTCASHTMSGDPKKM